MFLKRQAPGSATLTITKAVIDVPVSSAASVAVEVPSTSAIAATLAKVSTVVQVTETAASLAATQLPSASETTASSLSFPVMPSTVLLHTTSTDTEAQSSTDYTTSAAATSSATPSDGGDAVPNSQASQDSSISPSTVKILIIIGGVVGGIIVLATLSLFYNKVVRRAQKRRRNEKIRSMSEASGSMPWLNRGPLPPAPNSHAIPLKLDHDPLTPQTADLTVDSTSTPQPPPRRTLKDGNTINNGNNNSHVIPINDPSVALSTPVAAKAPITMPLQMEPVPSADASWYQPPQGFAYASAYPYYPQNQPQQTAYYPAFYNQPYPFYHPGQFQPQQPQQQPQQPPLQGPVDMTERSHTAPGALKQDNGEPTVVVNYGLRKVSSSLFAAHTNSGEQTLEREVGTASTGTAEEAQSALDAAGVFDEPSKSLGGTLESRFTKS